MAMTRIRACDTDLVGDYRQVMASILGMEDRFDWKACTQSEQEDREDVQAFKEAFAPFDPSLEL